MANGDDGVVKILIEMGLNDDAARQAVQRINEIRQVTGNLNDGSVPEAWQSWEKYKNVLSGAGSEALGMREKVGILHLGLRQLGGSFPEIGLLSHLLFNPLTIGFATATLAIEAYFKWQEKVEKKYTDMVAAAEKVNDAVKAIVNSQKSADEQFIDLTKASEDFSAGLNSISEQIKRDIAVGDQFISLMKGGFENAKESYSDQVKTAEDLISLLQEMGKIDKEHADQLLLQIQYKEKLKAMESDRAEIAGEISTLKSELSQVQSYSATGDIRADFKNASAAKEKAQNAVTLDVSAIKDLPKQIQALTSQISAAEADAKSHPVRSDLYVRSMELANQLTQQRNQLQGNYDTARSQLEADQASLSIATENLKAVQEQKNSVDELNRKIGELNTKLQLLDSRQSSEKQNATSQFEANALTKLFQDTGTSNLNELAKNHLQELLSATGFSNQQIINLLKMLHDHSVNLGQVVIEVQRRVSTLTQQLNQGTFNRQ